MSGRTWSSSPALPSPLKDRCGTSWSTRIWDLIGLSYLNSSSSGTPPLGKAHALSLQWKFQRQTETQRNLSPPHRARSWWPGRSLIWTRCRSEGELGGCGGWSLVSGRRIRWRRSEFPANAGLGEISRLSSIASGFLCLVLKLILIADSHKWRSFLIGGCLGFALPC